MDWSQHTSAGTKQVGLDRFTLHVLRQETKSVSPPTKVMPAHRFGKNNAASVLNSLKQNLMSTVDILNSPDLKAELEETLHDDKSLPDKYMSDLAADVVDLLAELDKMLQPAHLVLADHFLGMSSYCPSRLVHP